MLLYDGTQVDQNAKTSARDKNINPNNFWALDASKSMVAKWKEQTYIALLPPRNFAATNFVRRMAKSKRW